MKIIFMGTPDFAVPALKALIKEHEVTAVITQPDRAKGRGGKVQYTPVKEEALKNGIPVYQPQKVKSAEFIEQLRQIEKDIIVVVAFGQILSKEILDMPKYGCVNIHASLLPKYRGAAPIQWAVIDGEKETGVTTMYMDVGLDTGDMIDRVVVPIEENETGGTLHDKLAEEGSCLILETLKHIENNEVNRIPQDDSLSCYAGMLDKKMGNIDFSKSAVEIERLIRGLNPWPSAYTFLKGKMLKIWEAYVTDDEYEACIGQIVDTTKDSLKVKTGKGTLIITRLQLEGKKQMSAEEFLRGNSINEEVLGC